MKVLVTGFGAFGEILDNPAARLARALDGWSDGGVSVIGEEIPVEYEAGPAVTIARARALGVVGVLGIGVAATRPAGWVEAWATRYADPGLVDNRGVSLTDLGGEGEGFENGPFSERLAEVMGIGVSRNAGRYVCNAWLYRVGRALPHLPVAFVHVPSTGLPVAWFQKAIPLFTPGFYQS